MPEKSSSRGPGLVNFDALTDATTHLIECCILSLTRRLEQDMKRAAEEEGVGDTKSNDVNYKQSRQKENTPKTLRETHQPPRAEVPRKQYKTNTKQTRAQERANAPRESRK